MKLRGFSEGWGAGGIISEKGQRGWRGQGPTGQGTNSQTRDAEESHGTALHVGGSYAAQGNEWTERNWVGTLKARAD